MIGRCTNPHSKDYKRYGEAGITVCNEWQRSFEAFFGYIGQRPSRKHQIDRIKNHLGYQPGNVRWATPLEQQRNRTNLRLIEFDGKHLCLSQWAELLDMTPEALAWRIKRWGLQCALKTLKSKRYRVV